jgi:integrase
MPWKRGEVWYTNIQLDGQRIRQPAGSTREQALRAEAELRLQRRALPSHGLEQALERYLREAHGTSRWHNARAAARTVAPHVAGRQISSGDIGAAAQAIIQAGRERAVTVATINRSLALLRRLANLAYEWGWTDLQLGKRVKLLPGEQAREVFLSPEQVEQLASAMPRAGDAVRLAAMTGLRRAELMGLTPADIVGHTIRLRASRTKARRARAVPVPNSVAHLLERLPWPFSNDILDDEWDAARAATGITHVRFHDLRHTYASWLVEAGVPLHTVGALLGHSSPTMTARYAHLAPDTLAAAVATLGGTASVTGIR